MSALPVPAPKSKRATRKHGLKAIASLIEAQMDEMGLSEEEKNLRVDELVEQVKRVKTARAESRSK